MCIRCVGDVDGRMCVYEVCGGCVWEDVCMRCVGDVDGRMWVGGCRCMRCVGGVGGRMWVCGWGCGWEDMGM